MAKILVVDDNIDMLDTLEQLLTFYDFEVVRAENGKDGVETAKRERPDLIILDALMPVMNGFEACEILKSTAETRESAVIFLSANYTKLEYQQRGLELGADDYILKPFNAKELIGKVNSLLHRKRLIEKLRLENKDLLLGHPRFEAAKKSHDSDVDSRIDTLTGVYNENFFHQRLKEEYHRALETKAELSVALIDADLFREVNEIYSEQTANYVLMKIANILLQISNSSEFVFRLEKDKFAIILPATTEVGAFDEAERIRTAILQTKFFDQDFFEFKKISHKLKQSLQNLTVSIGIAALDHEIAHSDMLSRAQEALSKAKLKGRNTTLRYSEIE